MPEEQVRIEYEPLHQVAKWPRNPKDHDIGEITRSLHRFGYVMPVLVDETSGRLVAGHGRIDALVQAFQRGEPPPRRVQLRADGEWLIPIVRGISFGQETEALAYLLADNQMTILGRWVDSDLADALALVAGAGPGLTGTGFDADDLDDLIKRLGNSVPEQAQPENPDSGKEVTCPSCHHQFRV